MIVKILLNQLAISIRVDVCHGPLVWFVWFVAPIHQPITFDDRLVIDIVDRIEKTTRFEDLSESCLGGSVETLD